ncbi:MAG: flagellar biosynthesis protein FlhB [Gammaproteobacteria bacterium]|nr:MAG: flagellar biosynthesis protein FlhB [Gammaproteobacteria bacterium]
MAESDSGERSEDPTSKKIEDARKDGQIARSKELGTMFVLVGSASAMMIMGSQLVDGLARMMTRLFSLTKQEAFDVHASFQVAMKAIGTVFSSLLWIFFIIALAAFVGNILLGGMSFSWKAAGVKPSKMSPFAGFKRMFGAQAAVELLKSILKFFVVAIVAYLLLNNLFDEIIGLSLETTPNNFAHAVNLLLWMFMTLTLSLIIIAVIDVPYQLWKHTNELKMTKQEVKDESKNSEGNPEIKGRLRRLQMEVSQRKMMTEVPNSDVVITNPTHYSVAIKYDFKEGGAPMIIAKGVDEMAIHIRKIAKEHNVEIIPSAALARSLYYSSEVNEEIPEELFAAVAQVLAFIFQLSEHKKGRAKTPTPLAKSLPIPDEFKY